MLDDIKPSINPKDKVMLSYFGIILSLMQFPLMLNLKHNIRPNFSLKPKLVWTMKC